MAAIDFSKNRFYFPVGTRFELKPEQEFPDLYHEVVYSVVKGSHLPDPDYSNDLEVIVVKPDGWQVQVPAHYLRRVR